MSERSVELVGRDPRELLPHGDAAVLLQRVVSATADQIQAIGRLPAGSAYAQGRRSGAALVEMAAQAAALHGAATALADGRDPVGRRGFLVTLKGLRLAAEAPVERDLQVRARATGRARPLAMFAVEIRDGDRVLLEGQLGTFEAAGSAEDNPP